jgi:hypothetical protein
MQDLILTFAQLRVLRAFAVKLFGLRAELALGVTSLLRANAFDHNRSSGEYVSRAILAKRQNPATPQ